MFTFLVSKHVLFEVTMFPAVEKHLSELTDVAGIAKYCFANSARAGYLFSLHFHHSNELRSNRN